MKPGIFSGLTDFERIQSVILFSLKDLSKYQGTVGIQNQFISFGSGHGQFTIIGSYQLEMGYCSLQMHNTVLVLKTLCLFFHLLKNYHLLYVYILKVHNRRFQKLFWYISYTRKNSKSDSFSNHKNDLISINLAPFRHLKFVFLFCCL